MQVMLLNIFNSKGPAIDYEQYPNFQVFQDMRGREIDNLPICNCDCTSDPPTIQAFNSRKQNNFVLKNKQVYY